MAPRCDVIIATKDRHDQLRACLSGLSRQTFDDFGVIVVDDGSTQPVRPCVDEFPELDARIIRLDESCGPAAARNRGVEASGARWVIFLDDDVVPDRSLVAAHLAVVEQSASASTGVTVSCGPFVEPADWTPTPWNLWEARQAKKEADALSAGAYEPTWRQFHTGNNCLPAAVFREVGGFDERFTRAEDDELALRLAQAGCRFVFEPAAIALHYSHRSLDAWLAIPRAYAQFDVVIDRLHPDWGYLRQKETELARRRLPLRVLRRLAGSGWRNRLGVGTCVTSARAMFPLSTGAALAALSAAYDLSYGDALKLAQRDQQLLAAFVTDG